MTELQTIFLTCLLGPEDKTAFKKSCRRAEAAVYRANNLEKCRAATRKSQQERRRVDPEKALRDSRESNAKSRFEAPEKSRRASCEASAKRRREKPEEVREYMREYAFKRYNTDPRFRIERCLRRRLLKTLQSSGASKSANTFDLLGCPVIWFETYLEEQFRPGMTWENHGPVWHLDHIKPCSAFDLTDPEQQKICFHWTNFQPLFASENLSKGAKYV